MSGYHARRPATVSQYLADLNTIPSPTDANQQQENYNLEDDLALFTNTEFFDFDLGSNIEQQPPVAFGTASEEHIRRENASAKASNGNAKALDLNAGKCIVLLHEILQSQTASIPCYTSSLCNCKSMDHKSWNTPSTHPRGARGSDTSLCNHEG